MKEIDGIKYVTKEDIISASAKALKKLAEDAQDPMIGMLVILASAEITSELFPKEENKEE